MNHEIRGKCFTVNINRSHQQKPWGIRLIGGCDQGTPIIVINVQSGSPSDGVVQRGDIIRKIGDYDSRDIRHQDAQNLFRNSGNTIQLVIQREKPSLSVSASSSRANSLPPGMGSNPAVPINLTTQFSPGRLNPALLEEKRRMMTASPHRQEIEEEIHQVLDQPYRTTPLVLPGAKIKKDDVPTESYLRHHPNPMMRAAPPHPALPHEIVMKQKVADTVLQRVVGDDPHKKVVHHPFNSPIGLYSEQNIIDSIHSQTSATPHKKTVVYDPAKSETYKALQEAELGDTVQEVTTPVQTKVFSPAKVTQPRKPSSIHKLPGPQHTVNSLGVPTEEIQQSNTFKRLMYMVLNDN
uniref:PDZ domain-containing protein n=1 Tax=Clastoptera arizonana TaxID=38151 RepID=A0A1B6D4Y7_9HEMI